MSPITAFCPVAPVELGSTLIPSVHIMIGHKVPAGLLLGRSWWSRNRGLLGMYLSLLLAQIFPAPAKICTLTANKIPLVHVYLGWSFQSMKICHV